MSSVPYGSVNPTPHKQAKNQRRALIVRRHRAMLARERASETSHKIVDPHRDGAASDLE